MRSDREILDWLQEQIVDTIYLDDGQIIDVRGGDLRKAIAVRLPAKASIKLTFSCGHVWRCNYGDEDLTHAHPCPNCMRRREPEEDNNL